MKKAAALILSVLIILSVFCACSGDKDEDVNYVVTFTCDDDNSAWQYETESEGIITVSQSTVTEADGKLSYVFLLESVGEGETKITFSQISSADKKTLREVVYSIKVSPDFKITASIISDKTPGSEETKVSVNSVAEAEKLVESVLIKDNPDDDGNLVFETKESDNGKYFVRVYRLTTDESGNTVMKYFMTYEVSENGEMSETPEEGIPDRVITSK
ncbi:MAG: hypothetical protein ACI4F5_05415 [Acutalibacteraceae bacterium]